MRSFLSIFIWAAVYSQGSLAATEKIKVSVYYESLCPDSAKFLTTQLYPTYRADVDKIDVDLVPYGRATSTNNAGNWTFTCEHGDGECYGNKVQSCAIDLSPVKESTEFVVCAMRSGDASNNVNLRRCAESSKVSWSSIQECLRTGKADELLVANGLRTDAVEPPISFIPTIIFNDVYSKPLQELAFTNFEDVFELIFETKGDIINDDDGEEGGIVNVAISYRTFSTGGIALIALLVTFLQVFC